MRAILIFLLAATLACLGADSRLRLRFDFEGDWSGTGNITDRTANAHTGLNWHGTNMLFPTNGVFSSQGGSWRTNYYITEPVDFIIPVSQYIAVTNILELEFLTNFTLSWWMQWGESKKADGFIFDCGYPQQFASGAGFASNSWSIWGDGTTKPFWVIHDSPDYYARRVISWPDMETNAFHHYALTVDCVTSTAKTYYDGALFRTTNSVNVPWTRIYGNPTNKPCLYIGRIHHDMPPGLYTNNGAYAAGFFEGKMDEIRIYNATLNQTDITALFNGQEPTPPAEPTPTNLTIVGSAIVSGSARLD